MAESDHTTEILVGLRKRAKIGPKTFQMLITHFGSVENILRADRAELAALPRISETAASAIVALKRHLPKVAQELAEWAAQGVKVLTILHDDYPGLLRKIDDPPYLLYTKGNLRVDDQLRVAVVGTTSATAEGIAVAVEYAKALAGSGAVVVSGLARGIDSAAHLGSLKAGGRSYAVLGCGFNRIYPPENQRLAEELLQTGAWVSECAPDEKVNAGRLIARNRILVGMSDAVLVVEVDPDSGGTLDAAGRARDQGKLLFLACGPDFPAHPGLVKLGAIPVESANHINLILNNCK